MESPSTRRSTQLHGSSSGVKPFVPAKIGHETDKSPLVDTRDIEFVQFLESMTPQRSLVSGDDELGKLTPRRVSYGEPQTRQQHDGANDAHMPPRSKRLHGKRRRIHAISSPQSSQPRGAMVTKELAIKVAKIVLKAQERQGKKVREQKYDDSSSSVPSSHEPGLNAKAFEVFREEFEAYKTHMNDGMDKMKKQFEEFKQSALVMSSTSQSDNSASVASLREILERHQTTMGTHEASLGNIRSEMEAFKRDHNAARETALTTIRSEVERHKSNANTLVVQLEKQIQVLQADKTQLPTMAHVNECLQKVQTGAEELAMLRRYVDTEVNTVSRKVEATAAQEEKDHRDVEAKISLLTRQAQGRDADAEDIKNEVSQARQDLRELQGQLHQVQSKTALDQQGISHKLATNESFVQRHGRETKASLETIFKRQDEMDAWMTQQDNETRQVRAKEQERHDALERWLEEHDNRLNRIGVSGAGSQAPDSAGGRPEIVEVISEARKYADKARGYASDAEGHATTSSTCQQLAQAALHDVNRVATAVSATKEAMETEMETAKAGLQGIEKEAHGQALLRLQAAEGMVQRAEQALVSSKATRPAADVSDFAQETSKRPTTIEDTVKRAEKLYAGLLDMQKKSDEDRDQHKDTCRTRYETNAADVSSLQQLYRELLDRTTKADGEREKHTGLSTERFETNAVSVQEVQRQLNTEVDQRVALDDKVREIGRWYGQWREHIEARVDKLQKERRDGSPSPTDPDATLKGHVDTEVRKIYSRFDEFDEQRQQQNIKIAECQTNVAYLRSVAEMHVQDLDDVKQRVEEVAELRQSATASTSPPPPPSAPTVSPPTHYVPGSTSEPQKSPGRPLAADDGLPPTPSETSAVIRGTQRLPDPPAWLQPIPKRWSSDYSPMYGGEVDLRWAQLAQYVRDGCFIPNLARVSQADWKAGRRIPKILPTGIPSGKAFQETTPWVKPAITGPVQHEPRTGGIAGVYGSGGQSWVDPTAESVIQQMAAVPRWDGEPDTLDEWEERYDRWRVGYGRRFDEEEQMNLLLMAVVNEKTRERHAKNRHRQRMTFAELYRDITGRKIRNLHEPGARFRKRKIPSEIITSASWADFMADWSEEGAEVTDGMNYRQATEALVVLMRVHMEECPDDTTITRAYRLIWKQQSEYGNEYSYLELYLLVMKMLLQDEYAKTSERFMMEAHGAEVHIRSMQTYRGDHHRGREAHRSGSRSPHRPWGARSGGDGLQQDRRSDSRRNERPHSRERPYDKDPHRSRSNERDKGHQRSGSRDSHKSHQSHRTTRSDEKRKALDKVPFDPNTKCFNCGHTGHRAVECPLYNPRRDGRRDKDRPRTPDQSRPHNGAQRPRTPERTQTPQQRRTPERQKTPERRTAPDRPRTPDKRRSGSNDSRRSRSVDKNQCKACGKYGHWQDKCPNTVTNK